MKGGYQSGQLGRTVNPLSYDFAGSNPAPPTECIHQSPVGEGEISGSSSVGRATAFQAVGRRFEPGHPLFFVRSNTLLK